jgi:hypothetical protein
VVHRQVGRTLVKIGHWIATRPHGVGNQRVRLGNRLPWVIDEVLLRRMPLGSEHVAFISSEWPDLILLDPLLALLENGFPAARVLFLVNHPIIFGTKRTLQFARFLPLEKRKDSNSDYQNYDDQRH